MGGAQDELKKLIRIHVENPDAAAESELTHQDHQLITGALEYKVRINRGLKNQPRPSSPL